MTTQLIEQRQYNLLLRWFVGLSVDEPVWVPAVFTKNRDRLLNTDIAKKLMAAILAHEKVAPQLSDDHYRMSGIRHIGSKKLDQAAVWTVRT